MTKESPLRAQPDSRILDFNAGQQQGHLFDELDSQADDQLLADYRQRYGLAEDPFSNDYSFPLFTGGGRRQVLDQLLHLAQFSNSLLVVLGEYGVGKTRIAHAFMDSLSESDLVCYVNVQSGQTLEQLFLAVIEAFGLPFQDVPSAEKLLSCLESFIEEQPDADTDGLAVVVLDNAHLLGDQTISVIASLLQSFPQQNRFHVVMIGEPVLMQRLERLCPEQLLVNDFYLPAFNLAESVDYLNFRMEMADYLGPEIFSDSLVDSWWRQAQGQLSVLHELAQERLLESVMPKPSMVRRSLPVVHIIAIAALISVVGLSLLYMGDDEPAVKPAVPVAKTPATQQTSSRQTSAMSQTLPSPATTTPVAGVQTASPQSASASSLELASTDTPVQPLLQSLPEQPTISAPTTAVAVTVDEDLPKEEIVPLAQLPTSPQKTINSASEKPQTSQASSVAKTTAAVVTAEDSKPVYKELVNTEPVPKPSPKPAVTEKVISTSAIGQDRQILNWRPSEYTIQLLGVSNYKAALDYVAAQANKKELLIFKSKRQGKDWFVVITGRFATNAQARQAIAQLPSAQRDAGPWPRDIKTIQQEIRAAQ